MEEAVSRGRPERGSALPLVLVMLAVAFGAAALLVEVARVAVERADAQAAADAAALAAVYEGRSGADDLAARNGAEVIGFRSFEATIWVEVTVGRARAEAWAELDWVSFPFER